MDKVGGDDGVNPPTYKQEFQEGMDLFEQSFQEYLKSTEPNQKAKFKDVMDKALDVMNKAASQCLNDMQLQKNEKLHEDYDKYINSLSDQNTKKITKDLDDLKKTI